MCATRPGQNACLSDIVVAAADTKNKALGPLFQAQGVAFVMESFPSRIPVLCEENKLNFRFSLLSLFIVASPNFSLFNPTFKLKKHLFELIYLKFADFHEEV